MSVVATNSLWTAIAIPSAAVLGAIVTMTLTRVNEATNRRRDRYAEAIQTLVAWTEYPYRVRRRTDDSPATLTALANHGHDLQERLALHEAWIATEHPALANTYAETRATLDHLVGPLVNEAWDRAPVTRASGMNLGEWVPSDECREAITNVQREIENRFGFRRFTSSLSHCTSALSPTRRRHQPSSPEPGKDTTTRDVLEKPSSPEPVANCDPPKLLRIVILAIPAVGLPTAAAVIGISRFPSPNAAFVAFVAVGSALGGITGVASIAHLVWTGLRKRERQIETLLDWTSSTIWRMLCRLKTVLVSSVARLRARRETRRSSPP